MRSHNFRTIQSAHKDVRNKRDEQLFRNFLPILPVEFLFSNLFRIRCWSRLVSMCHLLRHLLVIFLLRSLPLPLLFQPLVLSVVDNSFHFYFFLIKFVGKVLLFIAALPFGWPTETCDLWAARCHIESHTDAECRKSGVDEYAQRTLHNTTTKIAIVHNKRNYVIFMTTMIFVDSLDAKGSLLGDYSLRSNNHSPEETHARPPTHSIYRVHTTHPHAMNEGQNERTNERSSERMTL